MVKYIHDVFSDIQSNNIVYFFRNRNALCMKSIIFVPLLCRHYYVLKSHDCITLQSIK